MTTLHQLGSSKRWLPIGLIVLALIVIGVTLGVCFAVAQANGHLRQMDTWLPPISALGNLMPEHAIFACGFAFMSLCVAAAFVFRFVAVRDWLRDRGVGLRLLNYVAHVLAWLGLIGIVVMAAIPEGSSIGAVHLGAAAVGMGLLSVFQILHGLLCIVAGNTIDPRMTRCARVGVNLWSIVAATTAIALFLVWMHDVSFTIYEWTAVGIQFSGLLSIIVQFAFDKGVADGDKQPLLSESV